MKIGLIILLVLFQTIILSAQYQYFAEQPVFENGMDGYACFRIPAIITSPNGDLIAFAEGRVTGCNDYGDLDLVIRRSKDNGKTWGPLEIVFDNQNQQVGNPAPVVDLLDPNFPNGRIFLFFNTGNNHESEVRKGNGLREVHYITSTDNGTTWSSPTNITLSVHKPKQPKLNPNYQFKEDWRSYANTPGHAIQLKSGRLFVPANHSEGDPLPGFNEYKAHAFYSDDHGKSFHLSNSIEISSSNESIAVQLTNGEVMLNSRHQNGSSKSRIVSLSNDEGATWYKTFIESQLPSPVCQASILNYSNSKGQKLLLFSNPNSQERREKMTIRISFDNGVTWPMKREIRSGKSAYSDLVQQANGAIGLLYEHGNNGGIHYAHFNYEWLVAGN